MIRNPTLIHERVDTARHGQNPTVICRMPSGWAVLGDHQFLTGYSLLVPDPATRFDPHLPWFLAKLKKGVA